MDISKLLEKAREAAERRNYDYAVELYLQACRLSPDSVEARRELRAVENRVFKERGLSFGGKMKIGMHLAKGKGLMMSKKYDAAMEAAEEVLKIDPGNSTALMTLGKAAVLGNYRQAAMATYEDLTQAKGGGKTKVFIQASRELAYLYEDEGRIQEALERWGDVSKNIPGGDREATQKARDLSAKSMSQTIEAGTASGAKGSLARNIARDKDQIDRLDRTEKQIRTAEDLEVALKDIQGDIKKRPEDARLYGKLGDLYKQGERYEDAKKAYQQAMEKDTVNPTWNFRMDDLEIWKTTREFNELAKRFKAGEADIREEVTKKRAELLEMRKISFEEREKQYSTDTGIKFELGEIFFNFAKARKDNSLYDQAIKRFQVTFRDPKFRTRSGLMMGQGFASKGQYELALKRFEETLAKMELRNDDWKNLMYAKGDAQKNNGNIDDALRTFLNIYEEDVSFRDVSKRVEELQKKKKEGGLEASGDAAE